MKVTRQTVDGRETTKIKIRWYEGHGVTLNGVICKALKVDDGRRVSLIAAYGTAATYNVDGVPYDVFIDHDGHPEGALVTIITAI